MHQGGHNWSWGLALGLGVLSVGASAKASPGTSATRPVLVTPVVGSESVSEVKRNEIRNAVHRALEAQGYRVSTAQDPLGQAVIACQTSECTELALDAANAEFAIVPALWERTGGKAELTLTLIQRERRNVNVDGPWTAGHEGHVDPLVAELLAKRDSGWVPTDDVPAPPRKHPNAWLAGPVILIAGGTAAFIAIGVGAATRSDTQQLNTVAVAAWSAVGAAAIAGGIGWWVVGAKRRRSSGEALSRAPVVKLSPTQVDLRLRF